LKNQNRDFEPAASQVDRDFQTLEASFLDSVCRHSRRRTRDLPAVYLLVRSSGLSYPPSQANLQARHPEQFQLPTINERKVSSLPMNLVCRPAREICNQQADGRLRSILLGAPCPMNAYRDCMARWKQGPGPTCTEIIISGENGPGGSKPITETAPCRPSQSFAH
jgi:hypothetical protein